MSKKTITISLILCSYKKGIMDLEHEVQEKITKQIFAVSGKDVLDLIENGKKKESQMSEMDLLHQALSCEGDIWYNENTDSFEYYCNGDVRKSRLPWQIEKEE